MELNKMRITKSDERGIIYDCGNSSFIARKKGTISANHRHEEPEIVYSQKSQYYNIKVADVGFFVTIKLLFNTQKLVFVCTSFFSIPQFKSSIYALA